MRTIRRNVFETNSSSCHSLTMCSEQEYDDFFAGKILRNNYNDVFVTAGDIFDEFKNDVTDFSNITFEQFTTAVYEYAENCTNRYSYNDDDDIEHIEDSESIQSEINEAVSVWCRNSEYYGHRNFAPEYLDTFEQTYTTKSGEKVCAFGYYGHD